MACEDDKTTCEEPCKVKKRDYVDSDVPYKSYVFFISLAFLFGVVLRLYLIRDQVLLDDEWHGMSYVYGKSAWYLLTHFPLALATCPPLNLYRWVLLHSFGWNEILLRLPSLLAGISGLLVLPLALKDLVGRRTLIFFTWLLAISPFLIFYSRVIRPYSVVAQTGFLAIVFCKSRGKILLLLI